MCSLSGSGPLQQVQDSWNFRGNIMIWPREKVILDQRVCLLEEEEVKEVKEVEERSQRLVR